MAAFDKSIFVLSDGTGETAEKVVRAALLQFREAHATIKLFTRVRTPEEIRTVVSRAAEAKALLVFTVVKRDHRDLLHDEAERAGVEALDLIGALIARLQTYLGMPPAMTPGLLHTVSAEYFRRIEAIEFTVKHDDGRDPAGWSNAEVLLVGVSRTSKTPLSMYLAQKGWRVANVPLVAGIEPAPELFEVDQDRIFALTINLDQLIKIRRERLRAMGVEKETDYVLRNAVARELRGARQLFASHPRWPVLDITGMAVEESAAVILETLKHRKEDMA